MKELELECATKVAHPSPETFTVGASALNMILSLGMRPMDRVEEKGEVDTDDRERE